jgi:hypothetical protein
MTVYKVWIHIEQIDEEHDHHHEITELQAADYVALLLDRYRREHNLTGM